MGRGLVRQAAVKQARMVQCLRPVRHNFGEVMRCLCLPGLTTRCNPTLFLQQFGRSHRSNQVGFASTSCPGRNALSNDAAFKLTSCGCDGQ